MLVYGDRRKLYNSVRLQYNTDIGAYNSVFGMPIKNGTNSDYHIMKIELDTLLHDLI